MNSAIFRRNTRKGCGCMRGGLTPSLQNLETRLKTEQATLAAYEKRKEIYVHNTIRYKHRNKYMPTRIAEQDKKITMQKAIVNSIQKNINTMKSATANANAKAAAAAKAAEEAAAKANANAKAAAAAASTIKQNNGVFNTLTKTIQNTIAPQTTQAEPGVVQELITKTNNAVVAAKEAVNKSKKLAELANRANALAKSIRNMSTTGGKRNRRTRRK